MRLGPGWAAIVLFGLALMGCQKATAHHAPLGVATPTDRTLKGDLYLLPPGATGLPDFRTLKPVGALYVPRLDIPDQELDAVFPAGARRGLPFAIDYRARFDVQSTGVMKFSLLSDDGARLFIDGRLLIETSADAGKRTDVTAILLAAGQHQVEVQYFQDPHSRIALQLGCQAPGGAMATFPGCGLTLASTSLWRVWLMWVAVLAALGAVVIWQTRRRIARESRGLR